MSFKQTAILGAALLASAFGMSTAQAAGSTNATFDVLISINSKCLITSSSAATTAAATLTAINLAAHDTTDTNVTGSTDFYVLCTKGTTYTMSMKPGNSSTTGAGVMLGQAPGNSDSIPYQLRQTTATGTNWGTAAGSTLAQSSPGTGTAGTKYTVFAVVPTIPAATLPDNYKDTVTLTVSY